MPKHALFAVLTGILFVNCTLLAQCKVKPIVKKCMPLLSPYQYDSYAVKEITYSSKSKKEILEFSVFSDEAYKLVFGKTELPQEIGITIYDKSPSKKGKIIYFDESGKKGNFIFNFQPTTTGTYYIEYSIPAASEPNQKGCFVLLIGIKD
jgi:hypothetical protein